MSNIVTIMFDKIMAARNKSDGHKTEEKDSNENDMCTTSDRERDIQ